MPRAACRLFRPKKESAMTLTPAAHRASRRMFPVLTLVVLSLSLFSRAPLWAGDTDFPLTILHTNDVHAHIQSFDAYGQECTAEKKAAGTCQGGAARLATAVAAGRAGNENALFLDAGDWFQGSLAYSRFKDEVIREVVNLLGYQAMAPGNHEFDDGAAVLGRFINGVDFPVVACNMDATAEPELAGLIAPYAVLDVNGRAVGVVGVANEDTAMLSNPGPNVRFSAADAPLRRAVEELSRSGVNIVVALSHAGFERDKALAATIPGLDVIVGGHSHLLLSNTDAKNAVGPYPLRISGPGGDTACVVTVGCWGKYLGRLTLRFDAKGRMVEASGDAQPMDASVAEAPEMAALVASYEERLGPFRAVAAGRLETDLGLSRADCRGGECLIGDLAADAMLDAASRYGTQAAILNGGSIRAGLAAGEVTMGDLLTAFPFGNTLAVCEIMGADLLAALEHGVSLASDPQASGTGRFPQVAGLRFAFDPAREAGTRVLSAEMRGEDGKFTPVDPASTYRVAISDYLLRGGDGYGAFKDRTKNVQFDGRTMDEIVAGYLGTHSPLTVALDGRIERKGPGE
ncbi:multifunctional 2',3'-cyclic-nucleotide 2'-phosphodiesterase/5'-nucleotidase/3'-nucleotidase [Desulfolutivibrio sulfoxidireducens]|nr:multifunctional 2',3'-cyclic-nucleotide 2'-phosphodiesterase/5'-nucleotidase/3'-nucleotidase [Desulfolutivibrio sulfoxidireducens]